MLDPGWRTGRDSHVGLNDVIRGIVRAPGIPAGFKAGPVMVRDPEFRAASTMRDQGPRAESPCPRGNQWGGWGVGRDPLFNVGPGTSYVIPNSVRYPMRDHCVQRGIQDTVRDPDIRAAPNVGSWMSYGARNSMRDAIRGPGPRT